jgi:hypothetical protein
VTVLILAWNDICDASALARCMTIQELDLSWNAIDDDGAVQLSTMAPRLERLNVNRCHIDVRGFRAFLAAPFRTLCCNMLEGPRARSCVDRSVANGDVAHVDCIGQILSLRPGGPMFETPELQILQSLAKNQSLVALDDDQTWFKTTTSRRTVQHTLLRNAIRSHSTAIVPAACAALLRKSSGVALVFRMLCDHPDWITRDDMGPQQQRQHQMVPQDQQHSVAPVTAAAVEQRAAKRLRMNPPPCA